MSLYKYFCIGTNDATTYRLSLEQTKNHCKAYTFLSH